MKKYLIFLCLILPASALQAETAKTSDTEYASALYEFLSVSNRDSAYRDAVKQTLTMMKQHYPDAGQGVWDAMEAEFITEESFRTLVSMMAPVYEKHFTLKELKEIIGFYKTPVGKKYAESAPQVTADAMAIGYQWGAIMDEKLKEKIRESKPKSEK